MFRLRLRCRCLPALTLEELFLLPTSWPSRSVSRGISKFQSSPASKRHPMALLLSLPANAPSSSYANGATVTSSSQLASTLSNTSCPKTCLFIPRSRRTGAQIPLPSPFLISTASYCLLRMAIQTNPHLSACRLDALQAMCLLRLRLLLIGDCVWQARRLMSRPCLMVTVEDMFIVCRRSIHNHSCTTSSRRTKRKLTLSTTHLHATIGLLFPRS